MKLHNKILLGLLAGAVAGIGAHLLFPQSGALAWINTYLMYPAGQVFLRMLLMIVIPLILTSVSLGVAAIGNVRGIGRVGSRTLAYFLVSTVFAACLGLLLVNTVQPGDGMNPDTRDDLLEAYSAQAEGLQSGVETGFGIHTFVNIVPRNPVAAAADMDMLAVIFFALMIGAALTTVPAEKTKTVVLFLEGVNEIVLKIIDFAMGLAPYGVFGLIFYTTSRFGWDLLQYLGLYVMIVLLGLFLHGAVTISLLVRMMGGMDPRTFWIKARASIVTAFSTSSSGATLPTNMSVAERDMDVPAKIAGFVLPLGTTMNMNGSAAYIVITVIFLAQVFGIDLNFSQQLIVLVLSVLMAIGAAGVPGGALPLMMVILATVGVPPESIAIILGVDRLTDMSRTVLNVTGDLSASVYVARYEQGKA